ncbi:MAG TPA: NUDIX domain-containing protein [bacterium]|jgi:8-oxo-dGTP pyrophosphatase MutT (NUDIX family)|nr:NUDIX domain-containing protein [bacterium]HNZ51177.1 NUDIX domain-containing protein [bacterium]HOF79639.1 NUDIX domain-containing protein [bacterium]HOH85520.1 NUDIX domain-containing protein [bacterium]HOQ91786.1 NUDIX domain-containing protein [bacterium]
MHTKRVRAIIIDHGKVLTIKRTKPDQTYWVIPGGEVESGETNQQALIREIKEELGLIIEPRELLIEVSSTKPETFGQMEYFYACNIISGTLGSGDGPEFQKDSAYVGRFDFEWLSAQDLTDLDLRPNTVKNWLRQSLSI